MNSRAQLLEILDGGVKESAFEAFLNRTYCVENLNFYRRVNQYEALIDDTERNAMAQDICKAFIGDDSSEQVNIEGTIVIGMTLFSLSCSDVEEIKKNLEKSEVNLFAKAKAAAFKNMWNDSLSKFTESTEWLALQGMFVVILLSVCSFSRCRAICRC
jgi:hypothetical protein